MIKHVILLSKYDQDQVKDISEDVIGNVAITVNESDDIYQNVIGDVPTTVN